MESFGADSSINFQVSARNPANGNIMIGGNNDYVGLITEGIYSQPTQGAVLPASSNTFQRAAVRFSTGEWLLLDSTNAVFRLAANLGASTLITPIAATTRGGIVEFNGTMYLHTNALSLPDRDLEISGDGGATWDSDPGRDTTQGSNGNGIFTNINQDILLAIFSGGTEFATSLNGVDWGLQAAGNAGVPMNDASISDDGSRFCVVSQNGGVATNAGVINPQNNPWQSSGSLGNSIEVVEWIEQLNGFMIASNIGTNVGFVDAADPTRVIPGSWLGASINMLDQVGISDGEQMLIPAAINSAGITLRNVGQTGISG